MVDLTRKICKAIRQEEKQSLLKDANQIIPLLFSKTFGQTNPFNGKCDYATSYNKNLIKLLLGKILFSEEVLAENYLGPPSLCPKERWVCIGFPCISFIITKSLKTFLISQFRKILGFKDRENQTLIHLWNEAKKAKAILS